MQARLRDGVAAAWAARSPSQPDRAAAPTAPRRSQSRRVSRSAGMAFVSRLGVGRISNPSSCSCEDGTFQTCPTMEVDGSKIRPTSVIQPELGAVEQHPEHVREALRLAALVGLSHEAVEPLALLLA